MAGTLENPVILDPFQVITEVSWGTFTHVAFSVSINIETTSILGPFACSPTTGSTTDAPWTDRYLSESSYTGGAPSGFRARKNGEWVSTPGSDVPTVSGLPTMPVDFTHDPWTYVGTGGSHKNWWVNGPTEKWESETVGADTGIPVPSSSSDATFQSSTAANAVHWGDTITGSPQCLDTISDRQWAECTGVPLDEAGSTASYSEYASMTYSVFGVVAIMEGKAYRAVAVYPDDSLVLRVLCERSPADDPASESA